MLYVLYIPVEPSLIISLLGSQETSSTVAASAATNNLVDPVANREAPVSSNENTADDVNNLDQQADDAITAFVNGQQNGLDIVLDENSGDPSLVHGLALLGHGVLVGKDRLGVDAVDGGNDREIVLELVEVGFGRVDCAIERVDERGVEGTVREL